MKLSGYQSFHQCFNPSFTGIALVALRMMCERRIIIFGFNPSFTGIALVASKQKNQSAFNGAFQSFFYWNCLGGIVSIPPALFAPSRFNPSFTGIALVAHCYLV